MEKITTLKFLCAQLGWQGGTIHQALQAVKDLPEMKENIHNKKFFISQMFKCAIGINLIDERSAGFEALKELLK